MPETVRYVERQPFGQKPRPIKKVGREPGLKLVEKTKDGKTTPKKDIVKYFAYKKKAMFMNQEGEKPTMIIFNNHVYETDNKEDIKFLDSHPQFGVNIWHNAPPKEIANKLKRDREALTREPNF